MSEPIRPEPVVGLVSYSFLPRIGGCARLATQLAQGLPGRGWRVEVVAPLVGPEPFLEHWPDQVRVRWARHPWARGWESRRARALLLRALTREVRSLTDRVDLWLALDFQVGALAALGGARGRPVAAVFGADPLFELLFFHRARMPERPHLPLATRAGLTLVDRGLRRRYRRLDRVVLFDDESRPAAARYTPAPSTAIPMAVQAHQTPDPDARSRTPELLVVARLVPWKGVEEAIELARVLRERIPDLRLTIAGDGPLAERLVRRHRNDHWLNLRLRVPFDQMADLYRSAWALLHPTHYETFGLVAVEAMAHGLPVVASAVGPLPHLIEHGRTGFILDREDRPAWLRTLESLLQSPDSFPELRRAARDTARFRFGVDSMVGSYDRLLRRMLPHDSESSIPGTGRAARRRRGIRRRGA